MAKFHIIVYDFETVGKTESQAKNGWEAIPVSLAAKAYHGDTLEPFENGEFYSLMMPDISLDEVADSCYSFLKMSKSDFNGVPSQKACWKEFQEFVMKYNPEGNKWAAPMSVGQNIKGFDSKIVKRLNKLHLPNKGPKSIVFSDFWTLDLLDIIWLWFHEIHKTEELPDFKLETLLRFCRIPFDPAKLHNAQYDVAKTGELIMKFLNWHRKLYRAHSHNFGS